MKKTILRDALRIAREKKDIHPQYDYFMHYAFIVQNNKMIEWATNDSGVPPIHLGYQNRIQNEELNPKRHAEFNAWTKARGILDSTKPFECINIRLNKSGVMRLSAPCCCCYNFLKEMGCNSIYFTSNHGGWSKTT